MKLTVTESKYEAIPTGLYFAEIEELEDVEGKYGPQVQFDLRIVAGEHNGHTLRAWANLPRPTEGDPEGKKLGTNTKLYRWLQQLSPDASLGVTIDINDLVGQRVLAKVEKYMRADGAAGNKVTELLNTDVAQQLQQPKPKPEPQPQPANNGDNVDLEALAAQLNA